MSIIKPFNYDSKSNIVHDFSKVINWSVVNIFNCTGNIQYRTSADIVTIIGNVLLSLLSRDLTKLMSEMTHFCVSDTNWHSAGARSSVFFISVYGTDKIVNIKDGRQSSDANEN